MQDVSYGDNDPYVPQELHRSLAKYLKTKPKIYRKGGYLNTDAGYTKFPDLIDIVSEITKNK